MLIALIRLGLTGSRSPILPPEISIWLTDRINLFAEFMDKKPGDALYSQPGSHLFHGSPGSFGVRVGGSPE
jgi:hypothetical protein